MRDEYSERSFIWGTGVAGALGFGAYASTKGHWSELQRAVKGPGRTAIDALRSRSSGMTKYTGQFSQINALGDFSVRPEALPGFNQRIADLTYESIMGSKNPLGHSIAQTSMRRVLQEASKEGAGAYSVYQKAISELGSAGVDPGGFTKAVNRLSEDFGKSLIGSNLTRFSDTPAAMTKSGVHEVLTKAELTSVQGAELSNIMGKLQSKDVFGEKLVGKASLHKVGPEGAVMARVPIKGAGDITLPLSISESNVMYSGQHFTSRYIARGAWDVEGGPGSRKIAMKSYNQHYLETLTSSMTDDFGNRRSVKDALHQTNRRVVQEMMDTADQAAGKAAVYAPRTNVITSGARAKEDIIRRQMVYGGRNIDPNLLEEAISLSSRAGSPLTPFAGAGAVGKGTLVSGDIRAEAYGALGELFPAQKQPFQFLRSDFGLTEGALQMGKTTGTLNTGLRFGGVSKGSVLNEYVSRLADYQGYRRPNLITAYATGRKDVSARIADEMGLMSRNISDLQEYERIKSVTIRAGEGMPGHPAIVEKMSSNLAFGEQVIFDQPVPLDKPGQLGIHTKTSKAYSAGGPGMTQELMGFERLDEGRVRAFVREEHRMGSLPIKMFGQGDVKHMVQSVKENKFQDILTSEFGFSPEARRAMGDISPEMAMTASRFQGTKNPAALAQQQLTAMQVLIAGRIDKGGTMSADAKSFMQSPAAFLNNVFADKTVTELSELQKKVQSSIISKARSFGLTKGATGGLVFGALTDEQISALRASGSITPREAQSWRSATNVIGISAPSLGDLAYEGGSGKLGTMDVSGFRVLAQKGQGVGDIGAAAAVDIAERTLSPGAYDEMTKMHSSIIGADSKILSKFIGDETTDLAGFTGSLVSEEGRWFSTGAAGKAAGISERIYVPGTAAAPQLAASINTTTGEPIASELHRNLAALQRSLSAETVDPEAVKAAAQGLSQASHVEYAKAATERGKVLGSRVLVGQQMTAAQQYLMGDDVIGVSKHTGREMFEELIEKAPDDRRAFLQRQLAAFEKGEAVSSVGWRHPNVGPESVQFTKIAAMESAQRSIAYMPRKTGPVSIDGGKIVTKDLSPLVGWKGDFDKDQFVLSVIGKEDVDRRAMKSIASSSNAEYTKYLGRHYAMESMIDETSATAGSPLRGIGALREEARAHGYVKMATGRTNIALQKMKVALMANDPTSYDEMATAMWHLEETAAIGSKHGKVATTELFQDIHRAVKDQDENKLAAVFQTVFGEKKRNVSAMVENTKVSIDYDPQRWAGNIMGALKQTPDEIMASVELSQVAGRGTSIATTSKMADQLSLLQAGRSRDVATTLATGGYAESLGGRIEGVFAKARGRARAVSQVLGRNKKPMALGAAVAGAIMIAAPSISGELKNNPNKIGAAGGRMYNPEDSAPPSGPEMNPPKNGIVRSPRAYEMTSRVQGNYKAQDLHRDNASVMRQVAAAKAGGANARMNVKDDRSAIDSRILASKIHERM